MADNDIVTARVLITSLLFCTAACGDAQEKAPINLFGDTDHNGTLEGSQAEEHSEDCGPGVIVMVNVDDDDADQLIDNEAQVPSAQENDLARVVLQAGWRESLPEGEGIRLRLAGEADALRVWFENEPILGRLPGETVTEHQLDDREEGSLTFLVEGLLFNRQALLRVEVGIHSDQLLLSTAPFLMYSHLDPAQRLFVAVTADNLQLRDGLKAAIGAERVVEYDADLYDGEIWFQDEFEFGYQQTPGGAMELVLDAVTDWGLDPFPEEELLGPDFGWLERGERPPTIHTDSFGNLECSPPVTVQGVDYPFGRIYYGGRPGGKQMVEGLRTFLDAQQIQAPIELDVTWLIVGHVDEVLTFVPDASSQKGFKALIFDYQITMEILESLDPAMRIPKYLDMGFTTVGELLADPTMELNAEIDQRHMQPLVSKIREEFDLTDDDIIWVPGLWTLDVDNALAMTPNMVNLAVFNEHLLIADPFFCSQEGQEEDANGNYLLDPGEDLDGDGLLNTLRDPLASYLAEQLPEELTPHFLDDWLTYHMQGGEVHCATNIQRTPRADRFWWQVD